MRKVFAVLSALLMVAVAVQFFLAATGAFDTAPKDESFQMHRALGYGILLYAVVLTLFGALARMPGRLISMAGLTAALVLLQGVIAAIATAFDDTGNSSSTTGELVFGLHAVNALVIMGLAGTIFKRSRALSKAPGRITDHQVSGPVHPPS